MTTTALKVELSKTEVLEEVKNANRVLAAKNNLPVTETIILSLQPNKLIIKGTDGSKYFESVLNSSHNEEEEFALNRELFLKTLGAIQQNEFTLAKENERVTITASNGSRTVFNTSLYALTTDDVPTFPETNLDTKVEFQTQSLQAVLDKTDFSVAKQDASRESLKGIHIQKANNQLVFASTDSYRLSVVKLDNTLETDDFSIIVYPDFVNEVKKQLSDTLSFEFNDTYIVLKSGNRTISFPLIQAQYPNVEPLFPTNHSQQLKVKVGELKSLVENVSFIASKTSNNVFKFSIQEKEVTLSASHKDFGTIELSVENTELENDSNFEVSLNNNYMKDILGKFNLEDTATLRFDGKKVLITSEDSKLDYRHLIIGVISY